MGGSDLIPHVHDIIIYRKFGWTHRPSKNLVLVNLSYCSDIFWFACFGWYYGCWLIFDSRHGCVSKFQPPGTCGMSCWRSHRFTGESNRIRDASYFSALALQGSIELFVSNSSAENLPRISI